MPESLADKIARGEVKLTCAAGYKASRRLRRQEMMAYEEAKRCHYVTDCGRNIEVSNAYYRWCKEQRIPWVLVRKRRQFSTVIMDMLSVRHQQTLHTEACHEVLLLFRKYAVKPCNVSIGTYSYCDRVRIEDGWTVASLLWSIGTAPRLA